MMRAGSILWMPNPQSAPSWPAASIPPIYMGLLSQVAPLAKPKCNASQICQEVPDQEGQRAEGADLRLPKDLDPLLVRKLRGPVPQHPLTPSHSIR